MKRIALFTIVFLCASLRLNAQVFQQNTANQPIPLQLCVASGAAYIPAAGSPHVTGQAGLTGGATIQVTGGSTTTATGTWSAPPVIIGQNLCVWTSANGTAVGTAAQIQNITGSSGNWTLTFVSALANAVANNDKFVCFPYGQPAFLSTGAGTTATIVTTTAGALYVGQTVVAIGNVTAGNARNIAVVQSVSGSGPYTWTVSPVFSNATATNDLYVPCAPGGTAFVATGGAANGSTITVAALPSVGGGTITGGWQLMGALGANPGAKVWTTSASGTTINLANISLPNQALNNDVYLTSGIAVGLVHFTTPTPTVTFPYGALEETGGLPLIGQIGASPGSLQLRPNANDLQTSGAFRVFARGSVTDDSDKDWSCYAYNPLNSNLGLSNVSANIAQVNGSNIPAPNVAGTLPVDVFDWKGTAPAAVTASGYIQTALQRWLTDNAAGTPLALQAGNVQVDVNQWNAASVNALSAAHNLTVDVQTWLGNAPAALTASGYLQAMVLRWLTDNGAGTPNALVSNRVDASVGSYPGNTAQTGDSYARLGTPTGASIDADILTRLATAGYTAPLTGAQTATAVWSDTVAGDFTTAGSPGKQIQALLFDASSFLKANVQVYGAGSNPAAIIKNTTLPNFTFFMTDSSTHRAKAGLAVTGQVTEDGGALINLTNLVTEIGSGFYKVTLAPGDVNCTSGAIFFTAAGADALAIPFQTER